MRKRLLPATKEQLVQTFAQSVLAQTRSVMAGNVRGSNMHADRLLRAYRQLRNMGSEGLDALSGLLSDPNPDISSMAATFLLKYKTEEALVVLREVAKLPGLVGFEAGEAIKRWEEHEWKLDD